MVYAPATSMGLTSCTPRGDRGPRACPGWPRRARCPGGRESDSPSSASRRCPGPEKWCTRQPPRWDSPHVRHAGIEDLALVRGGREEHVALAVANQTHPVRLHVGALVRKNGVRASHLDGTHLMYATRGSRTSRLSGVAEKSTLPWRSRIRLTQFGF